MLTPSLEAVTRISRIGNYVGNNKLAFMNIGYAVALLLRTDSTLYENIKKALYIPPAFDLALVYGVLLLTIGAIGLTRGSKSAFMQTILLFPLVAFLAIAILYLVFNPSASGATILTYWLVQWSAIRRGWQLSRRRAR